MKTQTLTRIASALAAAAILSALAAASPASASFGLKQGSVDATVLDQEGHFLPQAGVHPFEVTTKFKLNTHSNPNHGGGVNGDEFGLPISDQAPLRNVLVEAPPGLIGNPTATPRCTLAEFLGGEFGEATCADSTQVGIARSEVNLFEKHTAVPSPVYNLVPQRGQPALFAFQVAGSSVFAVPRIRESDYGVDFEVTNIDETVPITGSRFTFWGVPASPTHDAERGNLLHEICNSAPYGPPPCASGAPEKAFLTTPTDCEHGPFQIRTEVQSWLGQHDSTTFFSHNDSNEPAGVDRCDRVPFEPAIEAQPTTHSAETGTGLEFDLKVPEAGLQNPDGLAQSLLKKAVVTLPDGFTLNPSAAEGLGVCTAADYAREKLKSQPGEGCPDSSTLGTVEIKSPLLEGGEVATGTLFLAQPDDPATAEPGAENPFDSLIAMYMVARVPERGVIVKSAGKVETDPATGQVTTTFDDLPQLPFSDFRLHFREGSRAALVTPSHCGAETTEAKLFPYSAPAEPATVTSVSLITTGVGGGPCPSGGLPPFKPDLVAGAVNNAAGRFSPFDVRLFRGDAEQEITHFSIKLPPGVVGKLAGIPYCTDAAVALAKSRERIGGGREEQLHPSCPAASEIGHTLVGAGVGSVLTYVPGKVYLAGPYNGSNISIVAITSGVVGPFDIGTIVVREALKINPETAEVFIDATGSDPIPHIVDGIATHIRDLRVYVDRPEFTLNPTSCERTSVASTVLGAGLDFASEADDRPLTVTTPFQAADCAGLGFAPKLSLSLRGGTRRGAVPAFRAVLVPRAGNANVGEAQVTLPHSEFLEQGHIGTVCTRVQFKAGKVPGEKCPPASVYGRARAVTPLLSEPLEGPVFLRSSNHNLPDLVAALHNAQVDIALDGRIDSVKGRIRNTFEAVPDAPVTKFVLEMQGGKKGLLVNSTNLCAGKHRALSHFVGQNGKAYDTRPVLKAHCGKGKKNKRAKR